VGILVLWSKHPITRVAIGAAVIELLSSLVVVLLIIFEYKRTTRPSKLTSTYLLAALMSDGVLLRTLYMRGYLPHLNPVVTTSAASKFVLLVLQSWPKTSYLKPVEAPYGKIDLASPIARAFLWWLNPLLVFGNTHILSLSDLYPLDHDMHSHGLRETMQKSWIKCKCIRPVLETLLTDASSDKARADKSNGHFPLVWASIASLKWPLLQTVPPRAGMIAISYAQTFLITAAIIYLETPAPLRDVRHAYGLIAAAGIIYVGNAVCLSQFN
jgi:ATP-binding cassette, subfamily C (CFTR/MRP), member 1